MATSRSVAWMDAHLSHGRPVMAGVGLNLYRPTTPNVHRTVGRPEDCASAAETGEHRAAQVPGRLQLVEDRRQLRQRTGARDVALHLARGGEGDELTHVLHRTHRRVDDGGVLCEEREGVDLDVALARRRQADADHQAMRPEQVEPEPEPGDLRREDQAGVDAADRAAYGVEGLVRIDGHRRAERPDELEALRTDVDPDDLVAERGRDLHGVVSEATSGADDGDRSARDDAVREQLLHRAVRGEPATGKRRLAVAQAVGDLHQRRRPYRKVLGERAHEHPGVDAQPRAAGDALPACATPVPATGAAETENDAVADRDEAVGARPERLDDPDSLVADRPDLGNPDPVAAREVEIGVADAGGAELHERLVGAGIRNRHLTDVERAGFEAGRFHRRIMPLPRADGYPASGGAARYRRSPIDHVDPPPPSCSGMTEGSPGGVRDYVFDR